MSTDDSNRPWFRQVRVGDWFQADSKGTNDMTTKSGPAASGLNRAAGNGGPMKGSSGDTIIAVHAACSKAVLRLGALYAATIEPERIDDERLRRSLAQAYADWQALEAAADNWFAEMAAVDLETVFDASIEAVGGMPE